MRLENKTNSSGSLPLSSDQNPQSKGFRIDKAAGIIWKSMAVTFTLASATAFVAVLLTSSSLACTVFTVSLIGLTSIVFLKGISFLLPRLPRTMQTVALAVQSGIKEFFALLATTLLYPINWAWFNPKKNIQKGQPILIILGYMHNSSGGAYWKYRLENMGTGPVFTINLGKPLTLSSIEEYAQTIEKKVEEIKKLTGRSDLLVIGHSMGGLEAITWALKTTKDRIIDIVTVFSPLKGTRMSPFGIGKCAREMCYNSSFTQDLMKQAACSTKVRSYCHIVTPHDVVVVPYSSGLVLENPRAENHILPQGRGGHLAGLFDDEVVKLIANFYNRHLA